MDIINNLDDLIKSLQEIKNHCMTGKEKIIFKCNDKIFDSKNDFIYVEKDSYNIYINIEKYEKDSL